VSDIIQLLPDSVANQIAAGEVIQRPASVVKELVENAIDAGANQIKINLKDAGRTLIQVTDNGKGMSPSDARLAFERHATSKIKSASDLFSIRTMGFRGEALASIAAVADVELRTKQEGDELGTRLYIVGSEVKSQEADNCPEGSNFSIKNLFFNVPARRKFLKANSTELKHIITEVQRVALANPELSFSLIHNDSIIYDLPSENRRKRIVNIFGKNINQSLVPVQTDTTIIRISGYIGQPRFARKTMGEQFFFVNGRFMRHPYYHKAVLQAYEKILPPETVPAYFLYFEVDPETIDINIHPTKTEVKFEDERSAWHIIHACIREALGKFSVMPSIEFDQAGAIDIPIAPTPGTLIPEPEIQVNPAYNPFEEEKKAPVNPFQQTPNWTKDPNLKSWDKLYQGFERTNDTPDTDEEFFSDETEEVSKQPSQQSFNEETENGLHNHNFLQVKNKYIISPVKSGLMVIDQRRAHERVLFEHFMAILEKNLGTSQRQLFPPRLELHAADAEVLDSILDELKTLGFEIRKADEQAFFVEGVPSMLSHLDARELVEKLLEDVKNRPVDVKEEIKTNLAQSLARASAINYGSVLKYEEIGELFDSLFACKTPNYSPTGKKIITIISLEEFEKLLK
jgi:DNA mismatch repair protein MutL